MKAGLDLELPMADKIKEGALSIQEVKVTEKRNYSLKG